MPVTAANTDRLTKCVDAAAAEITDTIDAGLGVEPLLVDPGQVAIANRVNITRGVEWWKAADAAFGVLGSTDLGPTRAPKEPFDRHRLALVPLKARWGVG